jgi:hypothetical protein
MDYVRLFHGFLLFLSPLFVGPSRSAVWNATHQDETDKAGVHPPGAWAQSHSTVS